MAGTGIIGRDPPRPLQTGAKNIARFVEEILLLIGQTSLDFALGDRQTEPMQQQVQSILRQPTVMAQAPIPLYPESLGG